MNPVVKWVGGKRQIIDIIISNMPDKFNNYYEPFIGGGAVLFKIAPKNAVINDVNQDLIALYSCFKDEQSFNLMIEELKKHEENHSEEYYYKIRDEDKEESFKLQPIWKKASRMVYLNKAGFNGLYRVNSKGYFNVPFGKKEKVKLYDENNINEVYEYFMNSNVKIINGDFEEACKNAQSGDFVYFDPPYDTWDNKESFTSYTQNNFDKMEQIRLANLFKELTNRGVKCMLSNHNTEFIRELYSEYKIQIVKARRSVNSKGNERGQVEEVLITNY